MADRKTTKKGKNLPKGQAAPPEPKASKRAKLDEEDEEPDQKNDGEEFADFQAKSKEGFQLGTLACPLTLMKKPWRPKDDAEAEGLRKVGVRARVEDAETAETILHYNDPKSGLFSMKFRGNMNLFNSIVTDWQDRASGLGQQPIIRLNLDTRPGGCAFDDSANFGGASVWDLKAGHKFIAFGRLATFERAGKFGISIYCSNVKVVGYDDQDEIIESEFQERPEPVWK
jgi:hypothetical protein